MNWLFWKEYRQNRVIVIALLVMLIVPHLFGLYAMWAGWHRVNLEVASWETILNAWKTILVYASLYSLALSQVALALIGGNAIAGERADRSAEFQVYLPITRKKILAAKLLLALAITAVIWLINPLIVCGTLSTMNRGVLRDPSMVPGVMIYSAVIGLTFFCVAWFFSSIIRSPTFSIVAGLVTPFIIWSLILYVNYLIQGDQWGHETENILVISYWSISLAIALPSFGFGTWLYLRRVEP
jgi:ABC-type transport system involved in multi-copper enzyme maturation permease subunit